MSVSWMITLIHSGETGFELVEAGVKGGAQVFDFFGKCQEARIDFVAGGSDFGVELAFGHEITFCGGLAGEEFFDEHNQSVKLWDVLFHLVFGFLFCMSPFMAGQNVSTSGQNVSTQQKSSRGCLLAGWGGLPGGRGVSVGREVGLRRAGPGERG